MIVYRNQESVVKTKECLAGLCDRFRELERRATIAYDDVEQLLIDFGIFESGLADALAGDMAMPCQETRTTRAAAVALGHLACSALHGRSGEYWLERFGRALADLTGYLLPSRLRTSIPEGYAWYALYPQSYIRAAEEFSAAVHPQRAVVIGIRSIGTSLSALVAGTLEEQGCSVRSYTVRPTGHPWDRKLRVADTLQREWSRLKNSEFLIVDEGPGISGSSFASVAEQLSNCGVPDHRITLFPSWDADADQLSNASARERWNRHRRYVGQFDPPWVAGTRDVSAGLWREDLFCAEEQLYPAVQPQHEARKFLDSSGVLLKFAGLGRFGDWKLDRQRTLAAAGFAPNALGFTSGYLATEFVPGQPFACCDCSHELLERMASYLAFRASSFPANRATPFETMLEMIEVNSREILGREANLKAFAGLQSTFESRPAVETDGRMMPHEWIRTARGILKTDAVDHHAGHFCPGAADIAWDLAAVGVEFELGPADRQWFYDRYAVLSGDRVPLEILKFYRTAYLAFRTAYASMAAESTSGTRDHERFGALRLGFACMLQRDLVGVAAERPVKVLA